MGCKSPDYIALRDRMINECGAIGETRIGGETGRLGEKKRTVPFCPLEILRDLNRDRTLAGRPATYRLNYCTTFYYHHHLPYNYCRHYWSNSIQILNEEYKSLKLQSV